MRKILLTTTTLAIVGLLVGAWFLYLSPAKASARSADSFLTNVRDGDAEDAYKSLSPGFKKKLSYKDFKSSTKVFLPGYDKADYSITVVETTDDSKQYVMTLYGKDVAIKNVYVQMVRSGMNWYVDGIEISS